MERKRFLLKSPTHLFHVETLLDTFPDAQLVFTHRRLTETVPSSVSLLAYSTQEHGGSDNPKFRNRSVENFLHEFLKLCETSCTKKRRKSSKCIEIHTTFSELCHQLERRSSLPLE